MTRWIIAIAGLIIVIVAGLYFFTNIFKSSVQTPPPATNNTPPSPSTHTYATTTYSITYPDGWTLNDSYAYDQFGPTKLINGISLTVPASMATGTNLSSDTRLTVEQLPRAKKCTGDIFINADVKATSMADGGVTYSVATSSGAGAGNFYEETVYAIASSSPCTAVRYFVHSSNIGNYPAGAVTEFDRASLVSAFDTIRRSLVLH